MHLFKMNDAALITFRLKHLKSLEMILKRPKSLTFVGEHLLIDCD